MNVEKIQVNHLNLTGSNDVIFKSIMLTHPNILKSVIQSLLHKDINKFKILNSELPKKQFIEKGKRLDIYLETEKEYIDIEVSTGYSDSIQNRNLSYMCHIFCHSIKKGEEYSEYKKSIIYNLIWNGKGKYIFRTGKLMDEYGNIISDMITYNMIDMDKVMEKYYNKDIQFIEENKYLIMLGLSLEELDELIEITEGDEIVMEYEQALETVLNDYEIPPYIEGERDREMLINGLIKETERAKEKGLGQGLEEGLKQGLEEGLKQGLEQGLEQGLQKAKETIARNLLEQGLDIICISKATGLSIEALQKL